MGFDLERHSPAVTEVGHASVLAHTNQSVLLHLIVNLLTEGAEVNLGGLIGGVLGPHHGIDRELGIRGAAAQDLLDVLVFVFLQPQFSPRLLNVWGGFGISDGIKGEILGGHLASSTKLLIKEVNTVRPSRPRPSSGPKPSSTACSG